MMVFWLIAALLVLAALLFLLPPLLKGQAKDALARDELNVTIFKDQLEELERDLEAGVLTREQYETARHDLERNFVSDAGAGTGATESTTDRIIGRATAAVITILVPVVAVSMYGILGSGERGLNPEQAAAEMQQMMQAETSEASLLKAVEALQARVQEDPENVEDWVMLARSHYFLQQYAQSSDAFAKASALLEDKNPDVLADYADSLAMANERNMLGRPYQLLQKALAIDPAHEKSLWMAGVAAFQAQDLESTLQYWERLLAVIPPGSEEARQMRENVDEIRANLGMPMAGNGAGVLAPQAADNSAPPVIISGRVSLAEGLAERVAPNDTVFVFARAVEGPRMPLAILQLQVKDLPTEFTLDDSMGMSPQLTLSSVDQVVVSARVSRGGNAMPQSGDLEGSSAPLNVREAGMVELVIDNVVP